MNKSYNRKTFIVRLLKQLVFVSSFGFCGKYFITKYSFFFFFSSNRRGRQITYEVSRVETVNMEMGIGKNRFVFFFFFYFTSVSFTSSVTERRRDRPNRTRLKTTGWLGPHVTPASRDRIDPILYDRRTIDTRSRESVSASLVSRRLENREKAQRARRVRSQRKTLSVERPVNGRLANFGNEPVRIDSRRARRRKGGLAADAGTRRVPV